MSDDKSLRDTLINQLSEILLRQLLILINVQYHEVFSSQRSFCSNHNTHLSALFRAYERYEHE